MFSKLAKMVTLAMILILTLVSGELNTIELKKKRLSDIFDNDSDFMRGFETGLFLR